MKELEKQARSDYYSLDTINEFSRLINLGLYPGKERKSVQKMHDYFEQLFKDTLVKVETNEWYQAEKKAMENISIEAVMEGGSGEYNPNYKVTMPDVFRKKA